MKCPCCEAGVVVFYETPEPHLYCEICFHRYKKIIPPKNYYRQLSGRSRKLEKCLKKKNLERLDFLRQYLKKDINILELGCAEGFFGEAVKNEYAINYYGIEPSRDSSAAVKKLDKVWDSTDKISSKVKFNVILAFHVIEHIDNLKPLLSKLNKVLDSSGIMIIEVPNISGNRKLPWDFNKEHIHLFSPSSISCLLQKMGFKIIKLCTGFYESAIYNDSIRLIVRKEKSSTELKSNLVYNYDRYLDKKYVVYGAGRDFESLVAPYINASGLIAIIDSSKEKIGKRVFNKTVQGQDAIAKYLNESFLVATYRYQEEIIKILREKGVNRKKVITIEDILSVEKEKYDKSRS